MKELAGLKNLLSLKLGGLRVTDAAVAAPTAVGAPLRLAPATAAAAGSGAATSSGAAAAAPGVNLAIIVPFRDQPLQNRTAQLARFAAYMPPYLAAGDPPVAGFHILIIEQSQDGYKFNRGKCLNVGFTIATDAARSTRFGLPPEPFTAFCFHDVDLLPQPPLRPFYSMAATSPVHIGAAWPRYAYSRRLS